MTQYKYKWIKNVCAATVEGIAKPDVLVLSWLVYWAFQTIVVEEHDKWELFVTDHRAPR